MYIPDIYSKTQNQWVDSFYKQNGYLGTFKSDSYPLTLSLLVVTFVGLLVMKFSFLLIPFANNFDPDQDSQIVSSDLDPKLLTL